MNILILVKKYEGGVGSVVKALKNNFENQGDNVFIISREDDLKIFSLRKSIFTLRKKTSEIVAKKKIDVIYSQDWSMAFPLIFPTRLFKQKHFSVFYGSDTGFSFFIQKIIGRIMGKNLISCNDTLKKIFPKSKLIYNRVDHNMFKPINGIKRIKDSVGFANWKTDEYNFNEIKKAVENAGKTLLIAEGIPKSEMPKFFNKIETFISLPPTYAGFGLVYLEAMASGVKKIVGSKYGGGSVLPITKIENYKNIKDAIINAESKDYRKWVLDNKFTWEDAVKELKKLFKK